MSFGFTLGDVHSYNQYGLNVKDVRRSLLPPIKSRTQEIAGMHGAYYYGFDYGMLEIEVDVYVIADSLSDLRTRIRNIADWLSPENGLRELFFDDETDKSYNAVLSGDTDLDQLRYFGETTLLFLVPDPFAFGDEIRVAVADGGSITPQGTALTYPIFYVTMTAAASEFKVTLVETGEIVRIVQSLAVGDSLVIDHEKGYVTVNGNSAMASLDLTSDFFRLQKGTNTFNYTPDAVATVEVGYKPRWK